MKKNYVIIVILLSFALAGCRTTIPSASVSAFYFDTSISITIYDANCEELLQQCLDQCEEMDKIFSRTRSDSELYALNHRTSNCITISDALYTVIEKGLIAYEISEHHFDITTGLLLELWNFNGADPHTPKDSDIQEALRHTGSDKISLHKNQIIFYDNQLQLDLGALAKGYIADELAHYLQSKKVTNALINLGGNIITIGTKPDGSKWKIGIQKPFGAQGESITTIESENQSIVSSGIYERCFSENNIFYHHLLDAKTGYPMNNELYQVTILSSSSLDGDMLSSVVYLLGKEKGMAYIESLNNVEALLIDSKQQCYETKGWPQ